MQGIGNISQIYQKLITLEGQDVLILPHQRADPDAIGASLGLAFGLDHLNCTSRILVDEKPAQNLDFLIDNTNVQIFDKKNFISDTKPDLLIYLDHHGISRLGQRATIPETYPDLPILIVDHHRLTEQTTNEFEQKNEFLNRRISYWIDSTRSSVSEMIAELYFAKTSGLVAPDCCHKIPPAITEKAAYALLTGIYGDTGGLRFSNTSRRTFEICGALTSDAIRIDLIANKLFAEKSLVQLKLVSYIFENANLNEKQNIIWFMVTRKLLKKYHAGQDDLEGVCSEMRNIAGIDLAILIREVDRHVTRVNLRSNENFDCALLANQFGGGGHQRAAGITFEDEKDLAGKIQELLSTAEIILNGEQ